MKDKVLPRLANKQVKDESKHEGQRGDVPYWEANRKSGKIAQRH